LVKIYPKGLWLFSQKPTNTFRQ